MSRLYLFLCFATVSPPVKNSIAVRAACRITRNGVSTRPCKVWRVLRPPGNRLAAPAISAPTWCWIGRNRGASRVFALLQVLQVEQQHVEFVDQERVFVFAAQLLE